MASRPIQAALYFIRKRKRVEQNPIQFSPASITFIPSNILFVAPGGFLAAGFEAGMQVTIEGAQQPGNNGVFLITLALDTNIQVAPVVVAETSTGVRIARILAG